MSSLTPSTSILGFRKAKHLLRRSCFQYSKTVLDQFATLTPQQALSQLTVEPTVFWEDPYDMKVYAQSGVSDDFWIHTPNTVPSDFPYGQFRKRGILSGWWWYNAYKQNNLKHKLIFFLHTTFTVSKDDGVGKSSYFYDYLKLLDFYAFGNIKTLAKKITYDNGMLNYLDNTTNNKNNPNENYAREFLELFTILKGPQIEQGNYTNYTETDIQTTAKVFSGIKMKPNRDVIDPDTGIPMGYAKVSQHNTDSKTFSNTFNNLTITGQSDEVGIKQEIDDYVEMVFAQEATAKAYVRKIYRYFVKSEWDQEVEDDIITPLSTQLIASDYNVLDVLKTLLKSEHFYDEDDSDSSNEIIGSIVKNPIQLLSEALSILQIELPNPAASSANPPTTWTTDHDYFYKFYFNFCYFGYFAGAGMSPFSPETVAGYPGDYQTPDFDRSWFSSNTIISRYKLIECFISGKNKISSPNTSIRVLFNSVDYVHNSGHFSLASDAQTLVTEISELLYCESIDQSRIDYFMTVLNEMDPYYWNSAWNSYLQSGVDVQVKIRLDALFTKMINAPEFQLM
jgi:uncharacterized protein (DUF1800 family)